MVIAFLLGPLGYLLMLVLIEWPARESCPACSRKRVVTRERCEHCGEPFAAQPKDGTEIFEANCGEHA
jgi:predicted amidophosphoribosyltransferase